MASASAGASSGSKRTYGAAIARQAPGRASYHAEGILRVRSRRRAMEGSESPAPRWAPLAGWPYALVCTVLGLGLAWTPMLFHGPIPAKFDVFGLRGALAVWAFYTARLLIGFWIGITRWPVQWWLRGPLCGFATMLPHA